VAGGGVAAVLAMAAFLIAGFAGRRDAAAID
jgi:hypothetical protein